MGSGNTGINPKILSLANQVKAASESGPRFVLMLGAGASLASGVKPTRQIMTELLEEFGPDIEGTDLGERFNKLWGRLSKQQRNDYLGRYLNVDASPGYVQLATLIREGYIDTIITFNFDQLLQKAMVEAGLREDEDFKVVVCGDNTNEAVVGLMDMPKPRVKVLKMHGSLTGTTFLWSDSDMLIYPEPIQKLMETLTKQPIIVCGYAFEDLCVARAFSTEGGPIICVNPSGVPSLMRGYIMKRRSDGLAIDGPDGSFDEFFANLATQMENPVEAKPSKPLVNPFKYLESYEIDDARSFLGRDDESVELKGKIEQRKSPVIFVMGRPKSGKTSFVKAGLLSRMNDQQYLPVYLRCRGTLEQTLSTQLTKWLPEKLQGGDGFALLGQLADTARQKVIVILDQFERVLSDRSIAKGSDLVGRLLDLGRDNLTVLCVSTDERNALVTVVELTGRVDPFMLPEFTTPEVHNILQQMASNFDLQFGPAMQAVEEEYARGFGTEQHWFSLAHVQAICHMLCESGSQDIDTCRRVIRESRATLELAITRSDIINFIEDVPNLEERSLLRDIIRLVSHPECNQKIVNFVRNHVSGMWALSDLAVAPQADPGGK
jgi:hypothetical protein